jgi:hypothetical protein
MAKLIKFFTISVIASIGIISPMVVSAGDYPVLYNGKAAISENGLTFYSLEGFDPNGSSTSRQKVLVSASNSRFNQEDECFSPGALDRLIDCMYAEIVPDEPYYSLSATAHPDTRLFSGKLTVNGQQVLEESVLVYASRQLNGDIFSKSKAAFQNFTTYGDYLNQNNPDINSTWKLNGYQIDPKSLIYWDNSNYSRNINVENNLSRLKGFATKVTDSRIHALASQGNQQFELSLRNDPNNPEGRIYWVDGDLDLKANTTFVGRGTIIATGDINISGEIITTNNDALGLISLNNITASSGGLLNLRAVLFAQNSVNISRLLEYTGSIVANKINLTGKSAILRYDSSLGEFPPPGISYYMSPALSEAD